MLIKSGGCWAILFAVMLSIALVSSCGQTLQPETANIVVKTPAGQTAANVASGQGWVAQLIGFEQVPRIYTQAQGQAILHPSVDGSALAYKLIAANIQNIMEAHIHLASPGQIGPVVAWLYPKEPPAVKIPGGFDGILGEGAIQATNLVGPLAGQALSALIDRMNAGEAYVDIQTEQLPDGGIRGQIRVQNTAVTPLISNVLGTVTATTGDNISIQTGNRTVTVARDAGTKIETGDVGPSGQLAVGVPVYVQFDPATHIASKVELEKPGDMVSSRALIRIDGTVTGFSGIYLTIRTASGDVALVEIMAGTVLQHEDGTPAARAVLSRE